MKILFQQFVSALAFYLTLLARILSPSTPKTKDLRCFINCTSKGCSCSVFLENPMANLTKSVYDKHFLIIVISTTPFFV